jgi:hypothetical protein
LGSFRRCDTCRVARGTPVSLHLVLRVRACCASKGRLGRFEGLKAREVVLLRLIGPLKDP